MSTLAAAASRPLPSAPLSSTPAAPSATSTSPRPDLRCGPTPPSAPALRATDAFVAAPPKPAVALKAAPPSGPLLLDVPLERTLVPAKAAKATTPIALDVPWESQFQDHGFVDRAGAPLPQGLACNQTAKLMMKSGTHTATPGGADPADNVNVATAKDALGHILPDPARAAAARALLDAELEAGRPVLVGVSWRTPHPGGNGGHADHYVVVTGRAADADGRACYRFHDPGALHASRGAATRAENRFFVDEGTGMLYRPGKSAPPGQMSTSDAQFEVSQVRRNR